MKKNICIFAGSSSGIDKANKGLAKLVGKTIAENNFDIVFADPPYDYDSYQSALLLEQIQQE